MFSNVSFVEMMTENTKMFGRTTKFDKRPHRGERPGTGKTMMTTSCVLQRRPAPTTTTTTTACLERSPLRRQRLCFKLRLVSTRTTTSSWRSVLDDTTTTTTSTKTTTLRYFLHRRNGSFLTNAHITWRATSRRRDRRNGSNLSDTDNDGSRRQGRLEPTSTTTSSASRRRCRH